MSKALMDLLRARLNPNCHPYDLLLLKNKYLVPLNQIENDRLTAYLSHLHDSCPKQWQDVVSSMCEKDSAVLENLTGEDHMDEFIIMELLEKGHGVDEYWIKQSEKLIGILAEQIMDILHDPINDWMEELLHALRQMFQIDLDYTIKVVCGIENTSEHINAKASACIINLLYRIFGKQRYTYNLKNCVSNINRELIISDSYETFKIDLDQLLSGAAISDCMTHIIRRQDDTY